MTTPANTEPGLRAIWQRLEELHAMKPTPAGRCRHCEAFQNFRGHAPGALCLDCNDRRLALKEQFNRFPIPADVVTSADALEAIRRDLVADAPRVSVPRPPAERLPYPDR